MNRVEALQWMKQLDEWAFGGNYTYPPAPSGWVWKEGDPDDPLQLISENGEDTLYLSDVTKSPTVSKRAPDTPAWKSQVDGKHYKSLPIQPMEYSKANGLDSLQHTAIKYITRFREKGGKRDLLAAIHCIEMEIDWEYPDAE